MATIDNATPDEELDKPTYMVGYRRNDNGTKEVIQTSLSDLATRLSADVSSGWTRYDKFKLASIDIINGFVSTTYEITNPSSVAFFVVGGPSLVLGEDFFIHANNKTLTWSESSPTATLLEAGDQLMAIYT